MKKLLILLSLSALVFGCDKHNDDYKNNIPEWHPMYRGKTRRRKNGIYIGGGQKYLDIYGMKHQLVDRYIQGYTTASSLNVSHTLAKDGSEHYFYITFNGNTICGGQYKKVTLAIPDSMSSQINSGTLTGLMMSLKWKTILSEPR